MSYDQFERSNYDGKPIMLYEFMLGSTVWRYSSGENPVVVQGRTYNTMGIAHEGYTLSGDPTSDDLTITLSARADVADLFSGTPPSDPVQVAIRSHHFGDTEAPVVWSGTIKSMRRVSTVEVKLNCNSLLSTLNRNGLRLSWQRGCPHALYDRLCRVDPNEYATAMQVSSLTGTSLTGTSLSTLGDGYLDGGFMSFTGPHGTTERRAIERHVGNVIHLLGTTDGLSADQWVSVYPGCDRTSGTCVEKFNNLSNYGGFPHLPNKSPFDGDPVF